MSSTYVTLAEVLEARGGPLEEDEVWALLLTSAESLLDLFSIGHSNICSIISPTSLLLSANGTLAFKNCTMTDEACAFTAPEMLQGRAISTRMAMEKMIVYSLGMTLYWSVDYHIPQNQPVQLSDSLNYLLLSMCEDVAHRRGNLSSILEACESHHKTSILPPTNNVIQRLVEELFHNAVDQHTFTDSTVQLSGRSLMVRERLHGKRIAYPGYAEGNAGAAERRRLSLDSELKQGAVHQQKSWSLKSRCSQMPSYQSIQSKIPHGTHHSGGASSWPFRNSYHNTPIKTEHRLSIPSISLSESTVSLTQRKKKSQGPEFARMADDPHIILELPGSIVSKKGRSSLSQRDVYVMMPNAQCVVVRCDIKSRGRDVFDMVVAHANLVEHFYFGLAFMDDDEFFFLNHETKISKVAPDCWKKLATSTFTLFLRVKFFADDVSYIMHKLTRHQYYIQLRRDILEGRVSCNEDTAMFLAALALQAEFGDYIPEVYGKNYFQLEHYIPKRVMEKMSLLCLREELPRLHASNANMLREDAEIEFLKAVQQLPEYGVLFHRVAREKKLAIGELILGVCAKGIMIYEVKNNCRILIRRFQWSDTDSISTSWRKFTVECGPSGKKHSFVTESSKIAQYLLDLCSAQHKFHSEMTSRQLTYNSASDCKKVKHPLIWRTQQNLLKRMSCSEVGLNNVGLSISSMNSISKSCDDLSAKIQQSRNLRETLDTAGIRGLSELQKPSHSCSSPEPFSSPVYRIMSNVSLQKQDSEHYSLPRVDTPVRTPPEREIICVTLKKDPKHGFGFIIVGEDNTGKLDLGIFIASIIPDGPADKDGRIRPGGRLISLNKTSLEGVTFSAAASILQNSPDEVELIVSQPKHEFVDRKSSLTAGNLGLMLERGFDSQITQNAEHRTVKEDTESNTVTPNMGRKLHIPVVRILDTKNAFSRSSFKPSLRPGDLVCVELKKVNGSLGICVTGGINTSVRHGGIYIKSLISGGAADLDGRIQTGDRLLEVNGCNLQGVTHKQAVECLKKTGEVVSLLLERDPPLGMETSITPSIVDRQKSPSSLSAHSTITPTGKDITMETPLSVRAKDYSFVSDENTLEVTLEKKLSGLGFSFLISDISPEEGSIVRIRRLFYDQSSEESSQLREGDIILTVNGESVKGLGYQKVLQLLRGTPSELKLLICRPSPGQLPELDSISLSPSLLPSKKQRTRSLDLRVESVCPEINEMLQQKTTGLCQRKDCSSPKPNTVRLVQQRQDSEQDETPSTLSSPPSLPSTDGQQEGNPDEEDVPSSTSFPQTSTTLITTTENPAQHPLMLTPSPASPKPELELKEDMSSKNSHSSAIKSDFAEDLDGSRACFMANGLDVLADEEYLSITTSATSLPICSTASTSALIPPLPPSPPPRTSPSKSTKPSPPSPLAQPISTSANNGWDEDEDDEDEEDPRREVFKEFELTVTLTKSRSGSFGFTITRSKLDNCYYIQEILDNPAKADGRLRAGDRLIMVNGHYVTNVSDEVAMSILRHSPKRLHMVLGRAVQNLLPPPPPDSLQDIIIYKTITGQMGIKLRGGIGSKWQGIYVQEVVPNSPASEEGSIQPNDRIVYINGMCTLGMSLEDAVKTCEHASRKVKLKAMRDDQPVTPKSKWTGLFDWKKEKRFVPQSEVEAAADVKPMAENAEGLGPVPSVTSQQESCILLLEFTKPERGGLGFSLVGGENGSSLQIKDICCGGVADQDGRLCVGDILLEVNGVIVSGLSHIKVVDILRRAEGTVQLTVYRDTFPITSCTGPSSYTEDPQEDNTNGVSSLEMQEDHLSFQSTGCPGEKMEQDSGNCTPTFQGCCPSLSVTDILQSRTDPQKQNLENSGKIIEKNCTDSWSSDDDDDDNGDDDDDTSQHSSTETAPPTGSPIVSEEELTRLALISPPMNGQYSGSRLKSLIQNLQNQLDQHDLIKEFMALGHLTPSDNCLVGKAPENREKNRYREILPYDKTRVPVGEKQDYINASYIRMKVGADEFFYISSQGPLPNTQDCFWQMVWENKSDVIAMMTREVERGRIKCHKYWPEKCDVPIETSHYLLILKNYQKLDYFHIKVIEMVEKETGATHFVKHLKFTTWPDHSTPRSSEQLVHFIRYMRALHLNGPIIVHCSAGIGRAGVLICTDVILGLIERDLTINVSEIVREMRLQRHGMIQTKEQYVFCYKVWLDVLQSISFLMATSGNQKPPCE